MGRCPHKKEKSITSWQSSNKSTPLHIEGTNYYEIPTNVINLEMQGWSSHNEGYTANQTMAQKLFIQASITYEGKLIFDFSLFQIKNKKMEIFLWNLRVAVRAYTLVRIQREHNMEKWVSLLGFLSSVWFCVRGSCNKENRHCLVIMMSESRFKTEWCVFKGINMQWQIVYQKGAHGA